MRTLSILPLLLILLSACAEAQETGPAILVFSKTAGYRHASIDDGIVAVMRLGAQHGFEVVATEDAGVFNAQELSRYAAVVFLSTTGDVLNDVQQTVFEQYIAGGGGYVGVHSASDTEYDWPWYGSLVGAYFASHPHIQPARLQVIEPTHPATTDLPQTWQRTDEWYNFKALPGDVNVLIRIDESSYEGGAHGGDHPMAWYHEVGGGRAFYTALGHTEASFQEPAFRAHLLGGIRYAARLAR